MHSLRRAACRLLSTPTTLPVRPRLATTSNPNYFAIPYQAPRLLAQTRWKSDNDEVRVKTAAAPEVAAEKAPETTSTSTTPTAAEPATDATATDNAVGSSSSSSSSPFEVDSEQIREAAAEQDPRASQAALEKTIASTVKAEKKHMMNRNQFSPKETVYIGNLFYDVTPEDVKEQMSKYGVVEEVNLIYDNRGISKGFGYVQFDTIASAKQAIQAMHLRIFEGRRVIVHFAQNNMRKIGALSPISKTLYVGNMAFEMTDRDINALFKDVVNVIDVRVSVDRRTGQPRGFVHVEFVDKESAQAAMEILSRKAPYGRKLRLDYSFSKRPTFPVAG